MNSNNKVTLSSEILEFYFSDNDTQNDASDSDESKSK